MTTKLAREFDACGSCRLEVGGPQRYRELTEAEIRRVVDALERYDRDTAEDPELPGMWGRSDFEGGETDCVPYNG